ncbi:MAG: hypothetical protein GXY67_04240 [Clostridiales bacterium]|nr:hypothetical protein [Clostridiales bacterium]
MSRYQIWDKQSNVYTHGGKGVYTPQEWMTLHPWTALEGVHVVLAGGAINGALIDNLQDMAARYRQTGAELDLSRNPQEVLADIEAFEDAQAAAQLAAAQEAANTPSAQERIAAELEFQALVYLPDEEEV